MSAWQMNTYEIVQPIDTPIQKSTVESVTIFVELTRALNLLRTEEKA